MNHYPEDIYIYTAAEVGELVGIRPATVRKHAQLLGQKGLKLGHTFPKAQGGWVRKYSAADVAYLRTICRGTRGWPKGQSRKVKAHD
jgi:hypothetical protein